MDPDCDAFFAAYQYWYACRWPGGDAEDCEAKALTERYRLWRADDVARSRMKDEVNTLLSMTPAISSLPSAYLEFIEGHICRELEIPWLSFAPLMPDMFYRTQVDQYAFFGPNKLIPFAGDEDGYGTFVFDYRNPSVDNPSVFLWRIGYSPEKALVGPVFSSFVHALRILTAIMNHGDDRDIYIRQPPTASQVSFVRQLRAIDPHGFGGPGWQLWWKEKVLGVNAPDI
jgi:hypothetical protein